MLPLLMSHVGRIWQKIFPKNKLLRKSDLVSLGRARREAVEGALREIEMWRDFKCSGKRWWMILELSDCPYETNWSS